MSSENPAKSAPPARDWLLELSRAALILALVLLAASFLLLSPPPGQTYPGAIPWRDLSLLKPLVDLLSLGGLAATARGVEIKDFALHLAAALGLLLVGLRRLWITPAPRRLPARLAGFAQMFLAGWVLLSLASGWWSGETSYAAGQGTLYALSLGWAVALATTLQRRHIPHFLAGLVAISAAGAALCLWYFYERNPYHRPGFPLGNPTLLAAVLLPATLTCGVVVVASVAQLVQRRPLVFGRWAVAALLALVPLLLCLRITFSRGAILALVISVGVLILVVVGRRLRWVLLGVFLVLLVGGGAWWYHASHLDVTMARGASLRFRFYAWRYAVVFWQSQPVLGNGAGSYPRLAGTLSVYDRALDPAAFMGEIVEHAHNELFEVLAEIGLVGGVTFVAGWLATVAAASALLRSRPDERERWLVLAVAVSLVALAADAMFGVTLRLPGGPAVFFTLLGVFWALCREGGPGAPEDTPPAPHRPSITLTAVACFAAAGAAGWVAVSNWRGVVTEQAALAAYRQQRFDVALDRAADAQPRLLDPVRKLAVAELSLQARYALAVQAFVPWVQASASAPADAHAMAARAVAVATSVLGACAELRQRVPALTQTDATAARAAAMLYELNKSANPAEAQHWLAETELAWHRQERFTPFDVETLLALTQFRNSLAGHVGLLRDALRFLETLRWDDPRQEQARWLQILAQVAQQPGFEQVLADFLAAVGPITPQTDLDALIASMAPETYRLAAACHALRGEFAQAAAASGRAAQLYEPMRARFPAQEAVALAEQAEYLLRACLLDAPSPATPLAAAPRAAELLEAALRSLPVIQEQKYEELAEPFRLRLAQARLLAGQTVAGVAAVRAALGAEAADHDEVERTVQRVVYAAATLRAPIERLRALAGALCPEFPSFCQAASRPATSSAPAP